MDRIMGLALRVEGARVADIYDILREEFAESEARERELWEAAEAYRDLSTCYRIGTRPSEKLFKRLEIAKRVLDGKEEA